MIDGVRVLNTIPEQGRILFLVIVGAILALLCLGWFVVMIVTLDTDFAIFAGIGLIIGATFFCCGYFNKQAERYQVIVEDTVSMVEFNEHYKIIEQNGEIYTVEVK